MFFKELLSNQNVPSQIEELAKKFHDKKIVIYGAGGYANALFENYDLSILNIIAIADKKFENNSQKEFYGYKCISPDELKNFDCDIVLIANYDVNFFYKILYEIFAESKNKVKILPLIKIRTQHIPCDKLFSFLYRVINSEKLAGVVLDLMAKLLTCTILDKKIRHENYYKTRTFIMTRLFGYQVFKTAKSIGSNFWCGGFSSVTKNTIIKDNVNFNGMRIMGNGNVVIGDYFHSGIEVLILTQNHNYDKGEAIPYDSTYIYKDVEIGDYVWLGSRVTILPGTKIGEGAIIQGGAVVHGEIPPYAIAGGNPAKVFKYRDIEHFEKLKAEKKFH